MAIVLGLTQKKLYVQVKFLILGAYTSFNFTLNYIPP